MADRCFPRAMRGIWSSLAILSGWGKVVGSRRSLLGSGNNDCSVGVGGGADKVKATGERCQGPRNDNAARRKRVYVQSCIIVISASTQRMLATSSTLPRPTVLRLAPASFPRNVCFWPSFCHSPRLRWTLTLFDSVFLLLRQVNLQLVASSNGLLFLTRSGRTHHLWNLGHSSFNTWVISLW